MARLIKKSQNGYTNVNNNLIKDSRLTWKARGIFVYLWSQSDNWNFYVSELVRHSDKEGRDSLQSGLDELENLGYLKRVPSRKANGAFSGLTWILTDIPDKSTADGKDEKNTPKSKENTVDGENSKNTTKNADLPSDGESVGREARPTGTPPLIINNSKNYQYQELPTTRSNSRAKPDKGPAYLIERKEIVAYLNNKLGTNYRAGAKKNKERMNARLNEGYTVDDFKKVIDNKYADWADSPKMARYLRPETLFSPKFESYLNERTTSNVQSGPDYRAELKEWNEGN